MTKQELIDKLKELGVYDQWERYVRMNAISTGIPFISRCNHLLGCDFDWEDFIFVSFPWGFTDEGWDFWNCISKI